MFAFLKRKKKILIFAALFIVIAAAAFFAFNYYTAKAPEGAFCNSVDGYYLDLPEGFTPDYSFYPNAMIFNSENTSIEMYAEPYENMNERLSYINYTNRAITENTTDYENVETINDSLNNTIISWNRKKLSKIENDKNYYLKIDVPKKSKVYTMLVKSTEPIGDYEDYLSRLYFHNNIKPAENVQKILPRENPNFNEETKKFYDKYLSDEAKLTWGIFQADYRETTSNLDKYEAKIDHNFDIILWYTSIHPECDYKRDLKVIEDAYANNKIVEVTLQPRLSHEDVVGNDLFKLLDGYYDDFLNTYIKALAEFDHPILFRFSNEMNGDWCEYSGYRMSLDTELYREMYKYIYSIFEKYEADNVIWIWNPNGKSFPDFKWNAEEMYYPGKDYVDVLGLTFYNTGNFYEGEEWIEFEDLYKPLYERSVEKYDMPFMITEFACARAGGSKEDWTRRMFTQIEDYDKIKIAIWWNGADFTPEKKIARSYYIDDSEEMVSIFKEYFEEKKNEKNIS